MSEETTQNPYRVSARKYRPNSFADLIGQEPMVRTLSNAFKTGRIAQAYMLTGVRGIGKTTTARILARALNYKDDLIDEPSVELAKLGEHCQAIIDGNHLDVIEMDAASHTGIDDIRDLIESAQYKPLTARYKVYIIDEVHMLTRNAFNGLLKTLEEPPEHLKFIFATTEIRKVPITVLSRCQRFDLRRVNAPTMAEHLKLISQKENVQAEDDAIAMIVRAAEGSVRDAMSLLDQAISHSADTSASSGASSSASAENSDTGGIKAQDVRSMLGLADRGRVMDLFEHLMKGDIAASLNELSQQYELGAEPELVLSDLAQFIHFVTRLKYVPDAAKDPTLSDIEAKKGLEYSKDLSVRVLGRAWQILLKGIQEVAASERSLQAADMVLVRLAHAAHLPTPDDLIRQIENSEKKTDNSSGKINPSQTHTTPPSAVSTEPTSLITPSLQPPLATGTDGPALRAMPKLVSTLSEVKKPQTAENVEIPQLTLNHFEELIFLVEDKRDLKIKECLRRNVRVVRFSDGLMEINLIGDAPPNFIGELFQKLKKWTGKNWNIVMSQEKGSPSIEELERAEQETIYSQARSHPTVEAIIEKFPGAKIVDVRIRNDEPVGFETAEENNGLDEFFE